MAQTGYTPILLYGSTIASSVPLAANMTTSSRGIELAVNANDGKLFYKDSGGVIQTLASKAAAAGTFSNVTITGGTITGITDLAVADGGTGASTASGARTNLSAAQSGANSDITSLSGLTTPLSVAQGGTGVTTSTGTGSTVLSASPTFTGTPAAPTAAGGTNTTQIATTAFVQAALRILYPVGSIYTNAAVSTNPATLLGFGTWTAFGTGRVLVGVDPADPAFDTLGETGGSKDAVTVSHTHTASTSSAGSHTHGAWSNTTNGSEQARGFGNTTANSVAALNEVSTGYRTTLQGSSQQAFSTEGAHTHSVTVDSTGSAGTNANLQPYVTVYMWQRTA